DAKLAAGTATFSATLETAGAQTITATDTAKASLTGALPISVTAAADLVVSSSAPPAGTVGTRYSPYFVTVCGFLGCRRMREFGFLLKATGGVAPYTWSWAAASGSSLPPGLNLSNCLFSPFPFHVGACIAGIPTLPGTYNVALTAKDSGLP